MNRGFFGEWLKSYKKLDSNTINSRLSNCMRIEKYYGDLDELYNADRCAGLIQELTYSSEDKRLNRAAKHRIPIEGDIYNGTATFRSALNLFIEFKKNSLIEALKNAEDIDPDKHDGSYELMRETVRSLSTVSIDEINTEDLDLLYFMVIGTWRSGIEVKQKKIRNSHLNPNEKEQLLNTLERVKGNAVKHWYDNNPEEGQKLGWSIGMFGTGFHTFAAKADKVSAQRFIQLCIDLMHMNNDEEMFNKVDKTVRLGIKGMQSAAASVMLHCLKPSTFPVINSAVNDTAPLFRVEGVVLNKLSELEYYIQNVREIKKFRDSKCKFKNYRVMDLKLAVYTRNNDEEEHETDFPNDEYTNGSIGSFDLSGAGGTNYWWLNASPKIWSFSEIEVGQLVTYTSVNENGNKRKIYKNFEDVKKGDLVIGYESYPEKAIVAICRIAKEHDRESIEIEKIRNLINPLKYNDFCGIDDLHDMEYFKVSRGSLFKLTPDEFEAIMDLINEKEADHPQKDSEEYVKEDFLNEVFISEEQYDEIEILLKRKKNIILQGAPGVGKTFIAKRLAYSMMGHKDESRIEMIQFHQNYSYEDFVMGYRPVEGGGFELRTGVFYQFCRKASNDPNREYYFIIDEINRGNLSKIFGELLMLIENDKRGASFSIPLTYKPDSRFFVPQNVYIIGMMNTADRSLAMMDYALRRRFCFIEMEPAFGTEGFHNYLKNKGMHNKEIEKIVERMNYLNDQISSDRNLGKGFRIGHSYFCEASPNDAWYRSVMQYEINPLIEEYWFDNEDKAQELIDYMLE